MASFIERGPSLRRDYGDLFWTAGLSIGAGAVLLFLQFTPRPFLTTIAAVLWLVALMGVAALIQIREARASGQRGKRIAWRAAGAPYLVGAAILIADPLLGNGGLAYALAAGLGIAGIARLSIALGTGRRGRGWLYISGAVTIAVAMALGFGWPFALVSPAIKALALDLLILGITLVLSQAGGKS